MVTQKVITTSYVPKENVQNNILTSPIWKECYHEDEELPTDKSLWVYTIKFDGLTPIQVLNVTEYGNNSK